MSTSTEDKVSLSGAKILEEIKKKKKKKKKYRSN
jgi:hypothetical protein